jgi:hypothetical protein
MAEQKNSMLDSITKGASDLTKNASDGLSSLQKSVTDTYSDTQTKINEFSSSAAAPGGESSFLNANGLIAKFAFLILIIIIFLIALNLGIRLIYYFMNPGSKWIYLLKGMIDGNNFTVISQDPNANTNIVTRSNNQTTGIEFTWAVWLKLDGFPTTTSGTTQAYQPIFVKGGGQYNSKGVSAISNGPGVYFATGLNGSTPNTMRIMMDTVSNSSSQQNIPSPEIIDISNIPVKKWFHVAIRCQNKYLDVYVNGIVVYRSDLNNVPLQNYNNVEIGGNGGFIGKIADLLYYNRALNTIDINGLVSGGPNTTNASPSQGVYGGDYLSTLWYTN